MFNVLSPAQMRSLSVLMLELPPGWEMREWSG